MFKRVVYIGAPNTEGQDIRGCNLAPTALRLAGLPQSCESLGYEFCDLGDLETDDKVHSEEKKLFLEWSLAGEESFHDFLEKRMNRKIARNDYADIQSKVSDVKEYGNIRSIKSISKTLTELYVKVSHAPEESFILTVGGDHSIATSTICAMKDRYPDLCVIWIDAHADANTPKTSPSLHYHGMPAAHVLGWFDAEGSDFGFVQKGGCLAEDDLAYIGLRDVDKLEAENLKQSQVTCLTMREVDEYGIAECLRRALKKIDPEESRKIHLSLDIDAVDPSVAPGTGTCARGGLNYREIHYVCESLARTNRLVSMDLVEVNPALDELRVLSHGDNIDITTKLKTVNLGVELILSCLGKRIL